jgi:hypothetical protein
LAMSRGIWRVGVFTLVSLRHYRGINPAYRQPDPELDAAEERLNDPLERDFEDLLQYVIGPYLIGIGTILNGFSGYFHW